MTEDILMMEGLPNFTLPYLTPNMNTSNWNLLLQFVIWRSACWGSFLAGYPWMHFLMKWEMRQLPLQMLKELGTSEADCNNMLHKAEGAMVVESPQLSG